MKKVREIRSPLASDFLLIETTHLSRWEPQNGGVMNKPARHRRVKGLGEVSIRVRDLDAMRKFYEEVVGLEVLRRDESFVFFKIAEGYSGPVVRDFVPCACVHLCI